MDLYIDIVAGTPTTGLWCPKCLKSSGYEMPVHRLADDGPHLFLTLRKCHDCGTPLPPDGEPCPS